MSDPRVHIVLLNWNGAADTIECLESVLRIDYPNYQVIVCDNASTDDSVDHIRAWAAGDRAAPPVTESLRYLMDAPRAVPAPLVELDRAAAERGGTAESRVARIVLVHTGDNLGFAGNNVGMQYAMASRRPGEDNFVCLLNNDTVVAREWLSRMMAVIREDTGVGAAGAMLFEYHEPELVESAGGGVVHPWQGMPRGTTATRQRRGTTAAIPRRLDFLTGACMLMRASTLDEIGLIDERFFLYCEDIDLSLRIRRHGLRIALAADAEMWHKNGGTIRGQSLNRDYYMARNSLLLVHKLYPVMVPAAMAFSLYRCAMPKAFRGEWSRLRAVMRAYGDFFSFARGNSSAAGVRRPVSSRS